MRAAWLLGSLAIACLAGCSSIEVETERATGVDLGVYRTYDFSDPDPSRRRAGYLHARAAVARTLEGLGYRLSGDPELLVGIYGRVEEQARVVQFTVPSPFGWSIHGDRAAVEPTEGTLVIQLVDAARKEIVWQARARAALSADSDRSRLIDEAVEEVFARYAEELEGERGGHP